MLLQLNFADMFTGIIETTGTIKKISATGTNKTFWIESPVSDQLKVDQSIAHNGVCLTVEDIDGNMHKVTAVSETLSKTNLNEWNTGDIINLERCLQPTGRIDGHFVQGHTDTKGIVLDKTNFNGSWQFIFRFPKEFAPLLIEKGSVAVNGISLTTFNVTNDTFTVAIIPYTYQYTNLQYSQKENSVNLEFDMVGKYILRWAQLRENNNVL
jgi:riboflavin synthase